MNAQKKNLAKRLSLSGLFVFSLLLVLASSSLEVRAACSVVADQGSYNDGDTVRVTATNDSGGDWAVCIYSGGKLNGGTNLPVGRSISDSSTTKTASAVVDTGTDYSGWVAVVREGNGCNSTYTSGALCETAVNAAGTAAPAAGGEEAAGGTTTGETAAGEGGTTTATNSSTSVSIVNPLRSDDFTELITNFLQWLLGIAGSIALLMLIYGGVLYIASTGNQQQADQGKKIVTWTLAGLMVIMLSWSIIATVEDIFVN